MLGGEFAFAPVESRQADMRQDAYISFDVWLDARRGIWSLRASGWINVAPRIKPETSIRGVGEF